MRITHWIAFATIASMFLATCVNDDAAAQPLPHNKSWAELPEAQRAVAMAPKNARSSVAVVRQGLSLTGAGTRGFDIDADTEAQRGTFRLVIPLLEALGRVDPLRIALHYQARLWFGGFEAYMSTLDGDQANAPGWSLGLPKILGGIFIDSNGTRRPARTTANTVVGDEDLDVSYTTTDGSDIRYRIRLSQNVGHILPYSAYGEVRFPNGSIIVMRGDAGRNPEGVTSVLYTRLYATAIIDPHGNTTTIDYASYGSATSAARAVRLVDPLGREIEFHYTGTDRLIAITAPASGGGRRVLARLTYKRIPAYIQIDADDPAKDKQCVPMDDGDELGLLVGGGPISKNPFEEFFARYHKCPVMTAVEGIFFPATGTGYWFGDPDSYNDYGMLTKVVEQTQMAHAAPSLTEVGILTPGTTIRTRSYDFPKAPPPTGDRQAYPRFKTLTETFTGMSAPLVTHYNISEDPVSTLVSVTLPDGARRVTILDSVTGLPRSREVNGADGTLVSYDEYLWKVGSDGVPRLEQLTETDPLGRKKRTEYTFNDQGRAEDIKIKDWVEEAQIDSAPVLRWVRYEYVSDPAYAERGIRGLVRRVETYGPGSLLPEERTDYEYDGLPLRMAPGLERNLFWTTGFRTDLLASMPEFPSVRRGLLTKTVRWVAPQVPGNMRTIATEMIYTVAGTLAEVKVAGRTRFRMDYSAITHFALPDSIVRGAYPSTATTRLTWDVGTGALESLRRPSMAEQRFKHDDAMRLREVTGSQVGGFERTFAADGLTYTDTNRAPGGAILATSVIQVDGRSLPRKVINTPAGSPPTESVFEYNTRGRLWRFARRHAPGAPPLWTTLKHDSAGRVTSTVTADGSISSSSFDRAGAPINVLATGTLRKEVDPWGRGLYIVTDALGRTVQVLEPPTSGTAWTSTLYGYDARSNLLSIHSDAKQIGAKAGRRFQYDGLSRLTQRYLIERRATLDAAGNVALRRGLWSDVYRYNDNSQLTEHFDPRGVVVSYDYGNDPLGRLLSIRVTPPSTTSGGPTVEPVPETKFNYIGSRNPMRVESVESLGVYKEVYHYDTQWRVEEITTTFAGEPTPVRQRITRDSDNRVDRFAIGTSGETEVSLRYAYDESGRRIEAYGEGADWSVRAGLDSRGELDNLTYKQAAWQAIETFTVDAARGRFSRQTLAVAGSPVLDQMFYYDRSYLAPLSSDTSATDQLRAIKDAITGVTYEYVYDASARITGVTARRGSGQQTSGYEYTYDAAGNRINSRSVQVTPVPLRPDDLPSLSRGNIDLGEAAADGQRQLTVNGLTNHITNAGFAYDAAGNAVRLPRKDGSILLLTYDALGRVARVQREGSSETEMYKYNHNNQLVTLRRTDGSMRYSVWNGVASSSHFEAAPISASRRSPMRHAETSIDLVGRNVGRLLGSSQDSLTVEFLHHTPNGSAATGPGNPGLLRSSNLRPYGFDGSGAANVSLTSKYHSYGRSSFGLDYAVNRHYDPETGRFLQPDRLGQAVYRLGDPQSLNLYTFTRSDPINRRDPLGLAPCYDIQVLPDWSTQCLYHAGETIVRDTGDSWSDWIPQMPSYLWAPWQMSNSKADDEAFQDAVDQAALKQLRKLRDKQEKCAAANSNFATAANAYARVAANIAMHNFEAEALEWQQQELSADILENIAEQMEDPSPGQFLAAGLGRRAALNSIMKLRQAAGINKALLQGDAKIATDAMKSAEAARDAACN